MAIGAAPKRIFAEVIQRSLWLSAVGISAGLLPALLASRIFESHLYGVASTDLLTLSGTIVVQGAACMILALRAARMDPTVALRSE